MPKENRISAALERVSEAAHSLAIHGAGGYTTDTSAIDIVFIRTLQELRNALDDEEDDTVSSYFDPCSEIYAAIEGVY